MRYAHLFPRPMMNLRFLPALATLALVVACAPQPVVQSAPEAAPPPTLDRTVTPTEGPTPEVDFPDVQRHTLSNGLDVWVVERRGLPLVSLRMVVDAGSVEEPAAMPGLASFTASMLDEGTTSRSALEIADEIDFLGADFGAGASYDAAFATLNTLRRNLEPSLAVFADVLVNPSFPQNELARVRSERITSLVEQADQPTTVASQLFAGTVYGNVHPYGRPLQGTARSVRAFDVAATRRFYQSFYRPNNADLIVVGDVSAAEVIPMLELAFAGWRRAEVPVVADGRAPAAQPATRILLVDKPGAAQSEIRIGHVGVARGGEDYFPLLVMNHILGGAFTSRINLNLREDKGYTYGARSGYDMLRQAGPFTASAGVQTPSTKASVIEFMRELNDIRGDRPPTAQEVAFSKASLVRAEPLRLETNDQIAARLQEMVLYGLPMDYFDQYTDRIAAVSAAEVGRVARAYLDPAHSAVVVVGDRSVVEAGLRELPYPVEVVTVPPVTAGR